MWNARDDPVNTFMDRWKGGYVKDLVNTSIGDKLGGETFNRVMSHRQSEQSEHTRLSDLAVKQHHQLQKGVLLVAQFTDELKSESIRYSKLSDENAELTRKLARYVDGNGSDVLTLAVEEITEPTPTVEADKPVADSTGTPSNVGDSTIVNGPDAELVH